MKCPACGKELTPVYEDVDVGVGVQRYFRGSECEHCGARYGACYGCGRHEFEPHEPWCSALKELSDGRIDCEK